MWLRILGPLIILALGFAGGLGADKPAALPLLSSGKTAGYPRQ